MTATAFLGIIVIWMVWGLASLLMSLPFSLLLAVMIGTIVMFLARESRGLGALMALLEPIGVILPLLILRQVTLAAGWDIPVFSSVELLVFLVLYIAFLATAFGVIPVDLYRHGYAPMPVAGLVLALCLYGALSGNWFVPLVAVAGQALWVAGKGSSNYFDHIFHVMLVPVICVTLLSGWVS